MVISTGMLSAWYTLIRYYMSTGNDTAWCNMYIFITL
jgi:hypothetical protein